eukprot:Opistho-2@95393
MRVPTATLAVIFAIACAALVSAEVSLLDRSDLCDVCEIVTDELHELLKKTEKKREVFEIGGRMDASGRVKPKNKIQYKKSEVRLLEALDAVCPRMEDYRTNYWNKDLPKFVRKSESAKEEGAEVDMFSVDHVEGNSAQEMMEGIRDAIVGQFGHMAEDHSELRVACSNLLEEYEDEISEWYKGDQEESLKRVLCVDVLRGQGHRCYYYDVPVTREYLDKDTEDAIREADLADKEAKSKRNEEKETRRRLNQERMQNATARIEAQIEKEKKLEQKRLRDIERRKAEMARQKLALEEAARDLEEEEREQAARIAAIQGEEIAWLATLNQPEADAGGVEGEDAETVETSEAAETSENAEAKGAEEWDALQSTATDAGVNAAEQPAEDVGGSVTQPAPAEAASGAQKDTEDAKAIAAEIDAVLLRARKRYEELKAAGADEKTLRRYAAAFEAVSDD